MFRHHGTFGVVHLLVPMGEFPLNLVTKADATQQFLSDWGVGMNIHKGKLFEL